MGNSTPSNGFVNPRRRRLSESEIRDRIVEKIEFLNHTAHDLIGVDPPRCTRYFAAKTVLIAHGVRRGCVEAVGVTIEDRRVLISFHSTTAHDYWWHVPLKDLPVHIRIRLPRYYVVLSRGRR